MAASIDEVAGALRLAHVENRSQAAIAGLLADRFELIHHPSQPGDGVVESSVYGPLIAADQLVRAAPELRRELSDLKVVDDRIDLATRLVGALPDGVSVDVPFRMVCTVRDGRIVRLDSYPDVAASTALMAFAAAQRAGGNG